jgi:hypothetical protein
MADLVKKKVVLTGLNPKDPVYVACAAGGDAVLNSGFTFLHVVNGHSGAWVVTVNSVAACNQGFDHDAIVSVPASEERMIGPFDRGRFNDANGKIQITYDGVTVLTIAAIEVKP